jgi:hypothetical protein
MEVCVVCRCGVPYIGYQIGSNFVVVCIPHQRTAEHATQTSISCAGHLISRLTIFKNFLNLFYI